MPDALSTLRGRQRAPIAAISAALGHRRCVAWLPAQRHNRSLASASAAAETEAETAPVPVPDLDANVPPGEHWAAVQRWVVFTDLHVSERTLETCLEVLRAVRRAAEERDAGVIFLGDFWEKRNTLPLRPLNAVLGELRAWRMPVLMIPGNHDQVDRAGSIHGLTVLAAANPGFHVFDQPTLFLGALWLPFREDPAALRAAVAQARRSGRHIRTFAHTDVRGALLNNSMRVEAGLEPADLAAGVPVMVGHLHKPQTVGAICFLGTQYQVTAGEAGQRKCLKVLDAAFEEVEEVLLDIGPRHFTVKGPLDAAAFRPGDRVAWFPPAGMSEAAARQAQADLQASGLSVFPRVAAQSAAPRIADADALGAVELFQTYAAREGLSAGARARGLQLLQELRQHQQQRDPVTLQLHLLEVEGFQSIRGPLTYALGSKGLRVVVGRNEDESSSESNGSGKSSLLRAALWALTGKTNARLQGGGSKVLASEIVCRQDGCKRARVRLSGTANGQPFTVERATSGKRLAFGWAGGGGSETQLSASDTQARVDSLLGADLLPWVLYHTDFDVRWLLGADDKALKEALAQVVSMEVWQQGKERTARLLKAAEAEAARTAGRVAACAEARDGLRAQLAEAEQAAAEWEAATAASLAASADALAAEGLALRRRGAAVRGGLDRLLAALGAAPAAAHQQQQERGGAGSAAADADAAAELQLAQSLRERQEAAAALERAVAELQARAGQQQVALGGVLAEARARGSELAEYRGLQREADGALACDRCLQPVDRAQWEANLARLRAQAGAAQAAQTAAAAAAEALGAELRAAGADLAQAQQAAEAAARQLQEAQWRRQQAQRSRQAAEGQRLLAQQHAAEAEALLVRVGAALAEAGVPPTPGAAAEPAAAAASPADAMHQLMLLAGSANAASDAFARARAARQQLAAAANPRAPEAQRLRRSLRAEAARAERAGEELAGLRAAAAELGQLDAAFSRQGVQSLALEGVLKELEAHTAVFLEGLTDGCSLELRATQESRGKAGGDVERIAKVLRQGWQERSLAGLSSGEQKRVALALTLGFVSLLAARLGLRTNLLMLDEVHQQLDDEGCRRLVEVLEALPARLPGLDNILVVAQAHSFLSQAIEAADVVIKSGGTSRIEEMP